MKSKIAFIVAISILLITSCQSEKENKPFRALTELDLSESTQVTLVNGDVVNLTLVSISDRRDSLRSAIRDYQVEVLVDGEKAILNSGSYVRTFNSQTGNETWNFGDGTSEKTTLSIIPEGVDPKHGEYAHISHAFSSPGTYIVSVKRGNENGFNATTHLKVKVEE